MEINNSVIVLKKSKNIVTGDVCTTVLLNRFPYTLIQELCTHRLLSPQAFPYDITTYGSPFTPELSRNSGSSRAIPVTAVIKQVTEDPFIPVFTLNQRGMGGVEEFEGKEEFQAECEVKWLEYRDQAVEQALYFIDKNVHKQHINDILKPFMRIPIIITATEWDNFFTLRTHQSCRVEFRQWAIAIKLQMENTLAIDLYPGNWHIPFAEDIDTSDIHKALVVSSARCARLSYNTHEGKKDFESHHRLYSQLISEKHMSPFEHQVMAIGKSTAFNTRNLRGFVSHRVLIESFSEASTFYAIHSQ